MTCKDCLHYEMCNALDESGQCPIAGATHCGFYRDKSEWVRLPCKKGDVLIRNGERCTVDHWNVLATAFTESDALRLFDVEDAEKALEERSKHHE